MKKIQVLELKKPLFLPWAEQYAVRSFCPFTPGHITVQHVHKPGTKVLSAAAIRIKFVLFQIKFKSKEMNLNWLVQAHLYKNYNLNIYGPFWQ